MKTIKFVNFKDACHYAIDAAYSVEFSKNSTTILLDEWKEADRYLVGRLYSKSTRGFAKTFFDTKIDIISTQLVDVEISDTKTKRMLQVTLNYVNGFNSLTEIHEIKSVEGTKLTNKLLGSDVYKIIFTTSNY